MKNLIILLSIILIVVATYLIYDKVSYFTVVVKFDDLEPFENQMNVFFKGFKVGKTTKIYPNDDYTNTYLKLKLKSKILAFPENIKVNVKKKKTGGYVNILMPDEPSVARLKNNSEIQGLITKDISALLEDENLQEIVDDTGSLIENANSAIQNLNGIFTDVRSIISDNRTNINSVVKNLANTSSNLEKISANLADEIGGEKVSVSMDNIQASTANIRKITSNLSGVTQQIEETTLPVLNSTLCNTNSTMRNVSQISCGIKNTLKKRMGLSRLLFGKPMQNE